MVRHRWLPLLDVVFIIMKLFIPSRVTDIFLKFFIPTKEWGAENAPGAVEELLRCLSIVHSGRRRVALADIDVQGGVIRAGEGVIFATDVANRDEGAFADPDRLDVHRDARTHVAFEFGTHQCLGQPLARVELQVAYGTLYRRIPNLRLAVDLDKVPFKHDGLVYGVYELPVTW
jgi:cytochrome P450